MRKLAIGATTTLLALSLTACNNDSNTTPPPSPQPTSPQPSPTIPTTPTPSTPPPTTKPKPPPPAIPPAATAGLTVTSAEAFARFYLAAIDHMAATGDSALVRQWSLPTCSACRGLADAYEATYGAGGRITGDTHTDVTRVVSVALVGKDRAEVVLSARAGRTVLQPNRSAGPTPLAGGAQRWDLYLGSKAGRWSTFTVNLTE